MLKYNLASGNDYLEGWTNVDDCSMFPDCKVDVKENIFALAISPNSVDMCRLSHFIMYTTPEMLKPLLANLYSFLKQGGTMEIECIDVKKVSKIVASSQPQSVIDSWGLTNLFGNAITSPHKWGWTAKSLTPLLYQAGFSEVKVKKGVKKPNRDFLIIATK